MVSRKLFPRKGHEKEKVTAELKATINRIELKSKQFQKKSIIMRQRAKRALQSGDKETARTQLLMWKKYKNNLNKYENIKARIERHLDALEEATTIKDVGAVMGKSSKALEKISENISPEKALEISETAEESIAKIEEAGELLGGDLEEDFGLDIEEELTRLETELVLEDAGEIPTVPEEEEGMEESEEEELEDKDKLKKELAKLKKELEGSG
ncbi:MAG TPA: Snf7 family protein [Candidatus Lokiarchaeia archaeon]|nr:Snf7 family protein [Candidatus Lokiarchaeia archaeon]